MYKNSASKKIYEKALSDIVIKCSYEVYQILGPGYLEKVYENALIEELRFRGIMEVNSQVPVDVYYKNKCVGDYFADIIIGEKIIMELKSCSEISQKHIAQLLNYLKATGIKVGYVINFGNESQLQFKRLVL
jgi:GxxExxY protein